MACHYAACHGRYTANDTHGVSLRCLPRSINRVATRHACPTEHPISAQSHRHALPDIPLGTYGLSRQVLTTSCTAIDTHEVFDLMPVSCSPTSHPIVLSTYPTDRARGFETGGVASLIERRQTP